MKTKGLKVFLYYSILLAVFLSLSLLSIYVFKSRYFYLVNLRFYVLFEYCILAFLFFNIFKNKLVKNIVLYSIIPFTIYWVYDFVNSDSSSFSQTPILIEFLVFIILLIYFFYERMQTVVLYPIYQSITFWVCVAFFIYFTGNLFFMIFVTSSDDPAFITQMKFIYSFITLSKNIIISLAFFGNEQIESPDEILNIPTDVNLDEFSVTNYKIN